MSEEEPPSWKKNENSVLKTLMNRDYEVVNTGNNSYELHLKDSEEKFVGSYSLLCSSKIKKKGKKYFVMDERDVAWMEPKEVCLRSLTVYMNKYPNKRIYIRQFSFGGEDSVFSDDVVEIIPLALKQLSSSNEASRFLANTLAPNSVIPLTTFESFLNDFDVDKSLITMVPDFEYEGRKNAHIEDPTTDVSYIGQEEVLHPYQAIYELFRECVCGLNWNQDPNKYVWKFNLTCKEDTLQLMEEYYYKTLITKRQVRLDIERIRRTYKIRKEQTREYLLQNQKYDAMVSVMVYRRLADHYRLYTPNFDLLQDAKSHRVWLVRMMLLCGFIQSFFRDRFDQLKVIVLEEMYNFIPKGQETQQLKDILRDIAFAPPTEVKDVSTAQIEQLVVDRERREDERQLRRCLNQLKQEQIFRLKPPVDDSEFVLTVAPIRTVHKYKDYSNAEGLEVVNSKLFEKEEYVKIGDETFVSNFELCKIDQIKPQYNSYFVLSLNQFREKYPLSNLPDLERMQCLDSLTEYSKRFKTLVIRSIWTSTGHQVLAMEILEIIPLLMEKQGVSLANYGKQLETYRGQLDSGDPDIFYSVDVSLFKLILNSFNVDPDLITIIPDACHYLSMKEFTDQSYYVSTEIGFSKRILSKEQAILYIFLMVVRKENWQNMNYKSEEVLYDFRKEYFVATGKLKKMRKGSFVTEEYVQNVVNTLANHKLFFKEYDISPRELYYDVLHYTDVLPREGYELICDFNNIPEYSIASVHKEIPVWLAQSYHSLGWIHSFYPVEMLEAKRALVKEMAHLLPIEEREFHINHMLDLLEDPAVFAEQERKEREKKKKKMKRLRSDAGFVQPIKPMELIEPLEYLEPIKAIKPLEPLEPVNNLEPVKPTKVVQKSTKIAEPVIAKPKPKPPPPCKCSENGMNLLKSREALKKAENLAKRHEGKAKRTEKVENDLEKMTQKMKELEKEMEELGIELEETDEMERKMRVSNKEIMKEIGELEGKLKSEQENTVHAHQRSSVIKQKVEGLQVKLALKESQMEARKKNVKASNDAEPSNYHVPHVPKLGTTEDPELAANPDWHLEQWRKLKEECEKDDMIQEEKAMIERLLAKVEDHEVKTMVEYELIQFEGTLKIYLQNIDMTINKIEKTRDFSNLQPISKYPSLSKKFVMEFEKHMGV